MAPATKKTATKKPTAKKSAKKAITKKTPVKAAVVAKKRTTIPKTKSKKITIKQEVKKDVKAPEKTKTTSRTESKTAASKKVTPSASSTAIFGVLPYEGDADEEYMNEKMRGHFREILQSWRQGLMEEVDRTVNHMQDEAMRHPDPVDSASQEEEFNLELRTRDRERKLIRKIDKTLIRLEQQQDEYGYCEACGVEIGIRRLEARPTAELCIDCKTLDEILEKQTGG